MISTDRVYGTARQVYFVGLASLLVAALYLLSYIVYNLFIHPLRHFPGPRTWAATRLPYTYGGITGRNHLYILDLHKKYGPVVRVAPGIISFTHPRAMNDLKGHRKGGAPENDKEPHRHYRNRLNIIGANREYHARVRRALAHGFSNQTMLEQEPIIRQYVDMLFEGLRLGCSGGSKALDMSKWFNYVTFDIIGDLAFGDSFSCLEEGTYHPWISLIFTMFKETALTMNLQQFGPLAFLLKPLLIPRDVKGKNTVNQELATAKVRKRLATKSERPDFITALTTRAREMGVELSFEEVVSNASALIIAGSETTATLLTAATYYLALNPRVLETLYKEIRSQYSCEGDIDLINVGKLKYLLAVLDEGLRLYPPVPGAQARVVAPGGCTIADEFVPEGTIVDTWQWISYHDPANFAQAEEFIPERWLGDPRFSSDQRDVFNPFSVGPRNCIGRNLAYAEMRLILARLVWNYDIKLAEESEDWHQKNKIFLLWEKAPMKVYLTPREQNL